MPDSPLIANIPAIMAYLQQSFSNQIGRQGEYREQDILPGERFATLVVQSLRENPSRPSGARNVTGGISAWMFEFVVAIAVAVPTKDLDALAAQQAVDIVTAQEMLNLPHKVASIKQELPSAFDLIEDIKVRMPIDSTGPSQLLDDREGSLWLANITATVELWIRVRQDLNGTQLPLRG